MKPPIILVGYPGSQIIVPASKYLTEKYLLGFNIIYLNYKGGINGWGEYIADFLRYLTDDKVILGLDDYLISGPIDKKSYKQAEEGIGGALVCAKLCECSKEEQEEYPCTTQYTIWNKEFLISLLLKTYTPWRFEIEGSKIMKEMGAHDISIPCIPYYTNSCLSSRWEGVRLKGLNQQDEFYVKTLLEKNGLN